MHHGSLKRRLLEHFGGHHDVRKRTPQYADPFDEEESDTGMNLLYPSMGPVTVTITRTLDPTSPGRAPAPTAPSYDQNYEPPNQPPSTLVSTNLPSAPAPSTTDESPGTLGTPPSRSSPASPGDLNNPQNPQNGASDAADDIESVSGSSQPGKQGLPSGVLIGIVILCIFVVLAAIIFFVRRRYVRRRQRLRKGWTSSKPSRMSSPLSQHEPKISFSSEPPTMLMNAARAAPSPGYYPTPNNNPPILAAPPVSYGNEAPYAPPPKSASTSSSPVYGPPATTVLSQPIATVVSTFITTLPDEIAITIGEAIRVLAEYDDGWALCVNSRGEKGMIPMECLDGRYNSSMNDSSDMSRGVGGSRRRVSSLQPIVGNVGHF